jgi:SAM-dependent methyltransferase
MAVNLKEHWEGLYRSRRPTDVSWYQPEATLSAQMIQRVAPSPDTPIIDVGGGASVLVAQLAGAGYTDLTVLDLSGTAIAAARANLGPAGRAIHWIEADILDADLPAAGFAFWHDRAVFHFLTDPRARGRYVDQARRAVSVGGHVLVATFAEDGPTRCSGLEVMRYSPGALHAEFGDGFTFVDAAREEHHTPAGGDQAFTYCLCRRSPGTPTGA